MPPSSATLEAGPTAKAAPAGRGRIRTGRIRKRLVPYGFLVPSGILFSVFGLIPIGAAILFSFRTGSIIDGGAAAGAANYTQMVKDPQFWTALKNTAVFTAGSVPLAIAAGLLLAVLVNRPLPGRAVLRTIFFAPMVVSGVAVGVVMGWIFNRDYGVIDNLLAALGLGRVPWITSPAWAMATLVLAVLWSRIGFSMVLYLGALQSISPSLVEAAVLDGASAWQRFRFLTWPLLAPTTFFLVVINVVYSLQVFDLVYVLTGGGPGFATTVLIQYVYENAFTNNDMGYASAVGVVLAFILVGFTATRWIASRSSEDI